MAEIAASSAPDWQAIKHDVLCPLCEYNLRGLSEGRCPECGYRFDWAVITDPAARPHPYAFEQNPQRNFRSFFRTLWGTLRPVRFWSSLTPMQPSRPDRLMLYAFLCLVITLMTIAGPWFWAAREEWSVKYSPWTLRPSGAFVFATTLPSTAEKWQVIKEVWNYNRPLRALFVFVILWLLWPWITLLSLTVFQVSMHRARIKTIHVVRSILYSFDVGAWLGFIVGLTLAASLVFPLPVAVPSQEFSLWILCVLVTVSFVRLWAAYRLYLRFEHAFWTVLASQVMTSLFALSVYLDWERIFIGR